ncbi:hypothetical protein E8E12_005717 [Didymella heteroderae]|uniref:Uncharacterized protein n=1 Tax=Didymella heteroderae TaxID=1769908 RepID=A0A9P4WPF0_9PLEO|nr:hypothetical protein E8E12_005717 [Didymella heteroderae]
MGAPTSLTDTEVAANRTAATPLKNQGAYAGPTFHASPAPSALPIPKFLSRSVPAKTAPGPPTPPPDNSSGSDSASPSPSPSRAPIAIPARQEDSPLDMLFKADKAERAKNITFSPGHAPVRPQQQQQEYNVFPIELDGESRNSPMPQPPFQSPGGDRSATDPSRVPQLKDMPQANNGNDVMQDLMNRLSMSQTKPQGPMDTPPRQAPQASGSFQSPQFTPSPFNTGRPSVNRSVSGPTTPAQAPQDGPDFFYGNRNLSPMFKAAQGDTPKRNSGLRTEVTADSPTVQQNMFQDFPSIPSANAVDPNTFSRGQPAPGSQGPANARRGSVPYGQPQQRQPNKHVTQTPGRYQQRQDNHQRGRGNFHGQGPRHASQFFANSPAQDEKVAITAKDQEADFDAGIERNLEKRPSRFFRKHTEKGLPNPHYINPFEEPPPPLPKDHSQSDRVDTAVDIAAGTAYKEKNKLLPSRSASSLSASSEPQVTPNGDSFNAARKSKQADRTLKTRPSFASLRKSGLRIFRSNAGDQDAPPPPMPQIPVNTPAPKLHRPTLRPFESARSVRSSPSSKGRITSISRPISSVQSQLPPDFDPYKVPFTKPTGPPPPRPARPEIVDKDLVAMARDGGARTMVHTPNRVRTLTVSTVCSAWSPTLSRVGSEEAYSRLGLPSGHSSLSTPRSPIFDSPLASKFPMDPNMPLPFRDSDGSVLGYGRLSAYVKTRQGYGSGGYEDGVEESDRDLGPIEMYCESSSGTPRPHNDHRRSL